MLLKALITLISRCSRYALHCYREVKWDATLTLKGYWGDRRLRINTGWYDYANAHTSTGDSFRYEPTSYSVINKTIEYLQLKNDDVLIDYGCGSGRVIFAIATQRLKKVIGLEFDEKLVTIAEMNRRQLNGGITPVEIIHIDATEYNPLEATVIFFGNPFGEKTLKTVMDNIEKSLMSRPRNIRIVYFNSTGRGVLESLNWLEYVTAIDRSNLGTTVWRNKMHTEK